MKRAKNFLFLVVLFTVLALALAAAFYATRPTRPATPTGAALETSGIGSPASPVPTNTPPTRTPSAAEKRAKEFNEATSRFNAPDSQ